MSLAADIQALRERTLAKLVAAHDYFAETKIAWIIVEKVIRAGSTFSIENPVTGTHNHPYRPTAEDAPLRQGTTDRGHLPAVHLDLRELLPRPAPPLAARLPAEPRRQTGGLQDHPRRPRQGRPHPPHRLPRGQRNPL